MRLAPRMFLTRRKRLAPKTHPVRRKYLPRTERLIRTGGLPHPIVTRIVPTKQRDAHGDLGSTDSGNKPTSTGGGGSDELDASIEDTDTEGDP